MIKYYHFKSNIMDILNPKAPINKLIEYLSNFAREKTRFFIDWVNTPSLEEQKTLLKELENWRVEISLRLPEVEKNIKAMDLNSARNDPTDYLKDLMYKPLKEFAEYKNRIVDEDGEIDYELSSWINRKISELSEQFYYFQEYTRLLKLHEHYTNLIEQLRTFISLASNKVSQDTHERVIETLDK